MEYLLTKDITEFHDQEMKMLLQSGNASDLFFDELNKLKVKLTILRHDYFTYNAFKNKYEFTLKLNKDEDEIEMSISPPSIEEIIEFTNLRSAAKVTGQLNRQTFMDNDVREYCMINRETRRHFQEANYK